MPSAVLNGWDRMPYELRHSCLRMCITNSPPIQNVPHWAINFSNRQYSGSSPPAGMLSTDPGKTAKRRFSAIVLFSYNTLRPSTPRSQGCADNPLPGFRECFRLHKAVPSPARSRCAASRHSCASTRPSSPNIEPSLAPQPALSIRKRYTSSCVTLPK